MTRRALIVVVRITVEATAKQIHTVVTHRDNSKFSKQFILLVERVKAQEVHRRKFQRLIANVAFGALKY